MHGDEHQDIEGLDRGQAVKLELAPPGMYRCAVCERPAPGHLVVRVGGRAMHSRCIVRWLNNRKAGE